MFFHRHRLAALGSPTSRGKVRLLFGALQTGKTELLRQVVPAGEALFIDLSIVAERRRFETDPSALSREVGALEPSVRHLVIDEIQKVPALLDDVQALYDRDKARLEIYLTGSSARRLRR